MVDKALLQRRVMKEFPRELGRTELNAEHSVSRVGGGSEGDAATQRFEVLEPGYPREYSN